MRWLVGKADAVSGAVALGRLLDYTLHTIVWYWRMGVLMWTIRHADILPRQLRPTTSAEVVPDSEEGQVLLEVFGNSIEVDILNHGE